MTAWHQILATAPCRPYLSFHPLRASRITTLGFSWPQILTSEFGGERSMVYIPGGTERCPLDVRSLKIDAFRSELSKFPFLSEEEKKYPPTPQTWRELRVPKLRRYPTCQNVRLEELLDDQGMEGYIFKVTANGRGPFVLKVVRFSPFFDE